MLIANPIYDVVFKYLLEDLEIAKGLLSEILQTEILHIAVEQQETSAFKEAYGGIQILRMDFKAEIKTNTGSKKILIELQKGKYSLDIMRFRKYLGSNYSKPDAENKEPLPITTIYFLGFELEEKIPNSVIKVNRHYYDGITNQEIKVRSNFIEQLSHDSYVIQISNLQPNLQTQLEETLSIFQQKYKIKGNKKILAYNHPTNNKLLKRMIRRLNKAVESEKIREQMDFEDELDKLLESKIREAELIAEKNKVLESKLIEKDKVLEEQNKVLEKKDKVLEEQKRIIEELQQKLKNNQ